MLGITCAKLEPHCNRLDAFKVSKKKEKKKKPTKTKPVIAAHKSMKGEKQKRYVLKESTHSPKP